LGIFDWLLVDYPLPDFPEDFVCDEDTNGPEWQTKDLEVGMSVYKIIEEGLLIKKERLEVEHMEIRNEPKYRWVPVLLWDTVHFYTSYMVNDEYKWLQYKAKFDAGYVVSIEREYIEPFSSQIKSDPK
jgi:hypothetical protein